MDKSINNTAQQDITCNQKTFIIKDNNPTTLQIYKHRLTKKFFNM